MKNFITVYDFGQESLRFSTGSELFTFIILGIVVVIVSYNLDYKETKNRTDYIVFGSLFSGLALIVYIVILFINIHNYNTSMKMYELKEYKVIKGSVKNFDPMPRSGHKYESFTVNNIKFKYTNFASSYYGFHNAKSYGGPIEKNIKVQISYFESNNQNIILILRIKNKTVDERAE